MLPYSPTFSIKSANNVPISLSPLAEIVATFIIYSLSLTSTLSDFNISSTLATARSIPLLISIGLTPACTFLTPSFKIARVKTQQQVVPSPASSFVLLAAYFTN